MSRGPDIGTALTRAISQQARRADCAVEILTADWDQWASATFVGARHRMTLAASPCPPIERWLAGLAEAEFAINGHLVADLTIVATRRNAVRVEADLEILTIEAR